MARPKKCTVDYFPHFATGSHRTIDIIQTNYGNDGYALWFKLLEILAITEGHYLDLNDQTDLEYFSSKVCVSVEKSIEILDHLARLKAIDRELWEHRIVWSQNFVDNLSDLYSRRRVSVPQKPSLSEFMYAETTNEVSLCMQKPIENDFNESLCTTETTKVNKSIVKESKEKKSKENVGGVVLKDENFNIVKKAYEDNIGMLSSTVVEIIDYYLDEGVDPELIVESIRVACMNNKRTMSYAEGVLKNWLKQGITTIEQYKSSLIEKESIRGQSHANNDTSSTDAFRNLMQMGGGTG